jgi:uncharacterized membrane protein
VSSQSPIPPTAKRNIAAIAQLEQQVLAQRSAEERLGGAIARFFGSLYFILIQLSLLVAWILVNTEKIIGGSAFDPYPFLLLSLIVGIEFILLTTFVLMNQKHQMRRAEQWSHLHLQLSMLTEQEVTKNMQVLQTICKELGLKTLAQDQEVNELTQNTAISELASEINKARESDIKP